MTKHQQKRCEELAYQKVGAWRGESKQHEHLHSHVAWMEGLKAGYRYAVKDAEVLVKALKFYTDTNSWAYTTYDNFHTMHDDARTVKLPGGLVDMSGERAREALREYLGEE